MALDYSAASAGDLGANRFIPIIDETTPASPVGFKLTSIKRIEPLQTPTLATAMSKDLAGNFDEFRDEIIRPSASTVDVTYTVSNASTNKGKIVTLHLQNNSGSAWAFTFAGGTTRLYKGDTTNLATDTLTIADATDVEVSIKAVAGDKLLIIITEYTA